MPGRGRGSPAASGLIAIVAMLVSTLCYLGGDTLVKIATDSLPVPQIIAIRGLFTALLVMAAAAASGVLRYWSHMLAPRILLRGGFDAVTTLMFTYALANMRIADATAIINAVPIAATVLAVVFLRERVSHFRWLAIVAGFLGVLLVMQPDANGFNVYGFLALGAMISVAGREVITRGISVDVPSLIVTLCSAAAVGAAGAVASLATATWEPVGYFELGILAVAAVFLFGAYHFSVVAVRLGEVSLVSPFRYAIIVWGLGVGYFVWGDVPGWSALAGMALIVAAGLYVIRSEYNNSRSTEE